MDGTAFGMSRSDVRARLGEPEQVSRYECGDGETEAWYYRSHTVAAYFDSESGWRLTTLEVSAADALLNGRKVLGLGCGKLCSVLDEDSIRWTDEGEYVHVDVWDMNFWIEDGFVSDVQWGVPIGDDDREIWPDEGPIDDPMQTDPASRRR